MRFNLFIGFLLAFNAWTQDIPNSISEFEAIILERKEDALFQYWEISNANFLEDTIPGAIPALLAYRDSIKIRLAKKFEKLLQKESSQSEAPKGPIKNKLNNWERVHKGYVGKIKVMSWIEAQLINYQAARIPLFSNPTEFHGFVLQHDSLGLVRIYFGASHDEFPPKPTVIIAHIEESIQNGWNLKYHIHNHFRDPDEKYLGALASSLPDTHYYKILVQRFGLEEARITNGFHSLVIQQEEFFLLNSH